MITKLLLIAGAAACLVVASPTADAKDGKRHVRHAKAHAEQVKFGAPGFQQGPARMIEVRPGYFVSSYGCVTDEGYGRYSPCDLTDGGSR
jgi:hypothetical protein